MRKQLSPLLDLTSILYDTDLASVDPELPQLAQLHRPAAMSLNIPNAPNAGLFKQGYNKYV